jgi:phospholipase C
VNNFGLAYDALGNLKPFDPSALPPKTILPPQTIPTIAGTRIPLVVVSPWAKKGKIDHSYGDHASILKFVEKNWHLHPLSKRSRDNLPNPVQGENGNAYAPKNAPAISDLMGMFDFEREDY